MPSAKFGPEPLKAVAVHKEQRNRQTDRQTDKVPRLHTCIKQGPYVCKSGNGLLVTARYKNK